MREKIMSNQQEEKYSDGKGAIISIGAFVFITLWIFSLYAMIHVFVTIFRRIKRKLTKFDLFDEVYEIHFLQNVKYSLIIYLTLFILSFSYCDRPFERIYLANGKVPYENSGWFFVYDEDALDPEPLECFLNITFSDFIYNVTHDTDFLKWNAIRFFFYSPHIPYNIYRTFLAKAGFITVYDKLPVYKQTKEYEDKIIKISANKNIINPKLLMKLKTVKN